MREYFNFVPLKTNHFQTKVGVKIHGVHLADRAILSSSLMSNLIPEPLAQILAETAELKQSYLVGGCVRDSLMGIVPKDFDIEVFG